MRRFPIALVLLACSAEGRAPGTGNAQAGQSSSGGGAGATSTGGVATGGASGTAGSTSPNGGGGSPMGGVAGDGCSGGAGALAGSGVGATAGAAGDATAGSGGAGIAGAATGGAGGAGGATTIGGSGGKGGSAGKAGAGNDPTCAMGVYDASRPPVMRTLTGSLGAHDPALIFADGRYYEFATGLNAKTSTDLLSWQNASAPPRPTWYTSQVPGATNLWAPDISFFGGLYHLYYSASTFGSNRSCIGHATRASMSTGAWEDHGQVICSNVGTNDNWNAIDPNVIVDLEGQPWLDFGSFWSGIKMIRLDMTGARMGTEAPLAIANRPSASGALEGPFIIWRCGYYYLFVSFDHCCDSPWNYNIRVGRSTSVTGPYADKAGTAMAQGGGTLLVQGNSTLTAPGHNAVILTANGAFNVYHALNASHGNAQLRIAEMAWDAEGWPISAGP